MSAPTAPMTELCNDRCYGEPCVHRQAALEASLVAAEAAGGVGGRGVREGYTEGYTATSARGTRGGGGFLEDKVDLSFEWSEGPIGRRMRAEGYTKRPSCTPREPLVNPSNTPGEPLKPLKEERVPFMRPSAPRAQAQPLFLPGGVHGVHGWWQWTALVVAMAWLAASVVGAGMSRGWGRSIGLHALALAGTAVTIGCIRTYRRLGPTVDQRGWPRPGRDPSARWSEPRAKAASTQPSALDSETSAVGSLRD